MTDEIKDVPALVDTVVDRPMDFTVIATNPADMQRSQQSLILWTARKIQAIKGDIAEAQEQYDLAVSHKWNTAAWRKQIAKTERRADFYRKIKAALEAGYYIVPPFPIDVFAIRTDRATPMPFTSTNSDNHDQRARILPIGIGRYVDPKPHRSNYQSEEKQRDGKAANEKVAR